MRKCLHNENAEQNYFSIIAFYVVLYIGGEKGGAWIIFILTVLLKCLGKWICEWERWNIYLYICIIIKSWIILKDYKKMKGM